ncbi:hypothetical protein P7K49_009944 [Saguinus oedipus]|uniref:Uncharacterized protein n=1 Tax=Saguinus oedipus TaxID=9490 RepID=A0ABQ9VNQ6_SAGOE|nr:hypothetical protein P7K49_009944 [Saguinus oedipus]
MSIDVKEEAALFLKTLAVQGYRWVLPDRPRPRCPTEAWANDSNCAAETQGLTGKWKPARDQPPSDALHDNRHLATAPPRPLRREQRASLLCYVATSGVRHCGAPEVASDFCQKSRKWLL